MFVESLYMFTYINTYIYCVPTINIIYKLYLCLTNTIYCFVLNRLPPAQNMCGVDGCENPRKYSCSRTGVPLCSLQCYNANQLNIWNTVC